MSLWHTVAEILAMFLFLGGAIYLILRDEDKHWNAMHQYREEKSKGDQ